MARQYSDGAAAPPPLTLAIDGGSPTASLALGSPGTLVGERRLAPPRASSGLLAALDELLDEAGLVPADVGRIVAVAGPGSFTGLRVALATALGLAQALDLPAAAVTTFATLARAAGPVRRRLLAAVDALRGEWYVQEFEGGGALGPPAIRGRDELVTARPCTIVSPALGNLAARWGGEPDIGLEQVEALAPAALELAADGDLDWDRESLTRPLYLRPPPARPPAAPPPRL